MFVYRYPTVGELRVVDIGSCGGSDRPDMTSVGPDVDAAMFTSSTDVYAAWSYEDRAADLVVDYPAETAVGGRTVTVPQVIPAGRMQFSGLRFHQPGQVRVVCVTDPAKAALLREGDPYLYGALFHNHGIVCPAIVVDYDTATWVQADIPGLGLCLALDLRAVDESTATLFDETSQMYPIVGELRVVDIGSCDGSGPDTTSVGPDVDAVMFTCSTEVYNTWSYEDRSADLVVDYPRGTIVGVCVVPRAQVLPLGRMPFSGLQYSHPGQLRVIRVVDPARAAVLVMDPTADFREEEPYLYGALLHTGGIVTPMAHIDFDDARWVQADIPGMGLSLVLDLRQVDESATAIPFHTISEVCVTLLRAAQLRAAALPDHVLIGAFDETSRVISYTCSKNPEELQGRCIVAMPWLVQQKVESAIVSLDLLQTLITFYDPPAFLGL